MVLIRNYKQFDKSMTFRYKKKSMSVFCVPNVMYTHDESNHSKDKAIYLQGDSNVIWNLKDSLS